MTAILDIRAPQAAVLALRNMGHTCILLPPSEVLPAPIASHPDMLLFFAPDAIFCTRSYFETAPDILSEISKIVKRPLRITERDYGKEYPADILLNALPLGKHLFCHPSATAKELRTHPSYTAISVRQGYSKCAALPVGTDAVISADASILSAAKACGYDTLEIPSGNISLPGYDCGFIGGCASFAPYRGTDTVYLCGDLHKHPHGERMSRFCNAHGVRLLSLCDLPLFDVGTIFLI